MARKKKLPRAKKGEGSFRYNASGTLEYRFSYRDENWQAKRKSVTGADEQECYDRAQEFLDKMDKIHRGIDVDMTMIDILKEHYDADFAMNYVGEPGYARNLNSLIALQKHPIGSIPIRDAIICTLLSRTTINVHKYTERIVGRISAETLEPLVQAGSR